MQGTVYLNMVVQFLILELSVPDFLDLLLEAALPSHELHKEL